MIRMADRMSRLESAASFAMLARAKDMEAAGRKIIHLEVGQPDFDTPAHIKEACARALRDGHTRYTPAPGWMPLREAIAEHVTERLGFDVSPTEVVVTPGGKPIIFYTIMATIGPGDEAIVPEPAFPVYASVAKFAGGTVVPLLLQESQGFDVDLEALEAALTERTRLLVLCSPSNPTGGALSRETVQGMARLLQDYPQVMVLADEIYSRLIFEGEHHSIAAEPGMRERTIVLDGFSKTFAMTGWRLGWGILPADLVEPFSRQQINVTSCANAAAQVAGVAALTGPQDEVERMVETFRARRDRLVAGLNELTGVSCTLPVGAFYAFPTSPAPVSAPRRSPRRCSRTTGSRCCPARVSAPAARATCASPSRPAWKTSSWPWPACRSIGAAERRHTFVRVDPDRPMGPRQPAATRDVDLAETGRLKPRGGRTVLRDVSPPGPVRSGFEGTIQQRALSRPRGGRCRRADGRQDRPDRKGSPYT